MKIIQKPLKRKTLKSGIAGVRSHIPIGKVYLLDADSIRTVTLKNHNDIQFNAEVIDYYNESGGRIGFIYTELF